MIKRKRKLLDALTEDFECVQKIFKCVQYKFERANF